MARADAPYQYVDNRGLGIVRMSYSITPKTTVSSKTPTTSSNNQTLWDRVRAVKSVSTPTNNQVLWDRVRAAQSITKNTTTTKQPEVKEIPEVNFSESNKAALEKLIKPTPIVKQPEQQIIPPATEQQAEELQTIAELTNDQQNTASMGNTVAWIAGSLLLAGTIYYAVNKNKKEPVKATAKTLSGTGKRTYKKRTTTKKNTPKRKAAGAKRTVKATL